MTVVLYSCSTGNTQLAKDNTFAQKLANELGSGSTVIAPNNTLYLYSNGKNPEIENPGQWNTFTGR
jgi:hypothetical protein